MPGTKLLLGTPMFLAQCGAWILSEGGEPTARLALLTRILGVVLCIALSFPALLVFCTHGGSWMHRERLRRVRPQTPALWADNPKHGC